MADAVTLLIALTISSISLSCSLAALRRAHEVQKNLAEVWRILDDLDQRDQTRPTIIEHGVPVTHDRTSGRRPPTL